MKPISKGYIISLFLLLMGISLLAQDRLDKIAPELLTATQSGQSVECILHFRSKAKLQNLSRVQGKENKGRLVYRQLQANADLSQKKVRAWLNSLNLPYRSFLIANAIYLKADRKLLQGLSSFPEVEHIQANPWILTLDRPVGSVSLPNGRSPIEWALERIRVPEVWDLDIDGTGVIIGGQDTGVEWTHPTLKDKYRGWQQDAAAAEHNYNWFDAISAISPLHDDPVIDPMNNSCGLSVNYPCDDNDHGTYTMGIALGDDGAGNQIGVAPGAQWIACRNMERGYGSPASYLAGFEWFLAPTDTNGTNPRAELAPHVIINSWACPEKEGCTMANWGILETAINNLRAAGVVVIVSAGNEGPACNSIFNPPAIFSGAFSVGATNITDTLANFSSRGPVVIDNSNRIKPDVVAPGVNIRSAARNDRFINGSGTSAAGPVVVGVVALMIAANPLLAGEVELIEEILRSTSVPAFDQVNCGNFSTSDVPNPMTGYGRIDALAAIQKAREVSPVKETTWSIPIRIFPNPSTSLVFFEVQTPLQQAQLEIFDARGNFLEGSQINGYQTSIDLSQRPAGLYWWRLNHNGLVSTGKIVKP